MKDHYECLLSYHAGSNTKIYSPSALNCYDHDFKGVDLCSKVREDFEAKAKEKAESKVPSSQRF